MGHCASGRAHASHAGGGANVAEGDVVCFPRGGEGAHQIINRTTSAIRVLMLSTAIQPDVVEYLDTGRILAHDAKGEYIMFAKPGPPSDYWEGEC